MARTTPGVTRHRILTEASRLFANQGFASTSVADIHQACGLAAGSGALYKHFDSKDALLREIMTALVATMERDRARFEVDDDLRGLDLAELLRRIGRQVWATMESNRDAVRMTLRDLDQRPELVELMWASVVRSTYTELSRVLGDLDNLGVVEAPDPQGTATVLLAALTYHPILRSLIDRTPGDLSAERFLDAWVELGVRVLTPRAQEPGLASVPRCPALPESRHAR